MPEPSGILMPATGSGTHNFAGGCHREHDPSSELNIQVVQPLIDANTRLARSDLPNFNDPNHSERFVALLHEHYPTWREARAELNALPLASENWPTSP